MDNINLKYWNQRGKDSYIYKKEIFYTITPIVYYYNRRKKLLKYLSESLQIYENGINVLDFGCGDGWYLNYLHKKVPSNYYDGCDVSSTMVNRANENNKEITIKECNDSIIPFRKKYKVIYSIAVLAHITNTEQFKDVLKAIYNSLAEGGRFIFFEQISNIERQGENWIRRSENDYISILESEGFKFIKKKYIVFYFFMLFEWNFLDKIRKRMKGSDTENRIAINHNKCIVFLSEVVMLINKLFPFFSKKKLTGNTFFIFEKC